MTYIYFSTISTCKYSQEPSRVSPTQYHSFPARATPFFQHKIHLGRVKYLLPYLVIKKEVLLAVSEAMLRSYAVLEREHWCVTKAKGAAVIEYFPTAENSSQPQSTYFLLTTLYFPSLLHLLSCFSLIKTSPRISLR